MNRVSWLAGFLAAALAGPAPRPESAAQPPPTRVVTFVPAAQSESAAKAAVCGPSLAAGYRKDAYRCTVAASAYDPCFALPQAGRAVCDVDPRTSSSGFVVSFDLSASAAPTGTRGIGSRAWLFELPDGSMCRPILENRREISGTMEIYSCKFAFSGEADGVLGELDSSTPVWTIQQVLINKKVEPPTVKSALTSPVKTVWQ